MRGAHPDPARAPASVVGVPLAAKHDQSQEAVDRCFDSAAAYWRDVYREGSLQGLIYRRRMETALRWVDELRLAAGAAVLEVGVGAGLLSVELAARGLAVTGTDSSPEMIELVKRRVGEERPAGSLHVQQADAHELPFAPGGFQLVIGLGLLPWLHDPAGAVRQMERVLAPAGSMILTADNRARLNFVVEPRESPPLAALRSVRRAVRRRSRQPSVQAPSYRHLPSEVDDMLRASGVVPVRRATIGFGPFTFFGRPLLPERTGMKLHRGLERASRRAPSLRRVGWHYIVAGVKPGR